MGRGFLLTLTAWIALVSGESANTECVLRSLLRHNYRSTKQKSNVPRRVCMMMGASVVAIASYAARAI